MAGHEVDPTVDKHALILVDENAEDGRWGLQTDMTIPAINWQGTMNALIVGEMLNALGVDTSTTTTADALAQINDPQYGEVWRKIFRHAVWVNPDTTLGEIPGLVRQEMQQAGLLQ